MVAVEREVLHRHARPFTHSGTQCHNALASEACAHENEHAPASDLAILHFYRIIEITFSFDQFRFTMNQISIFSYLLLLQTLSPLSAITIEPPDGKDSLHAAKTGVSCHHISTPHHIRESQPPRNANRFSTEIYPTNIPINPRHIKIYQGTNLINSPI